MDIVREAIQAELEGRKLNLLKGFGVSPEDLEKSMEIDLEKAVYADTPENRKLNRVGQEYHRGKKKAPTPTPAPQSRKTDKGAEEHNVKKTVVEPKDIKFKNNISEYVRKNITSEYDNVSVNLKDLLKKKKLKDNDGNVYKPEDIVNRDGSAFYVESNKPVKGNSSVQFKPGTIDKYINKTGHKPTDDYDREWKGSTVWRVVTGGYGNKDYCDVTIGHHTIRGVKKEDLQNLARIH